MLIAGPIFLLALSSAAQQPSIAYCLGTFDADIHLLQTIQRHCFPNEAEQGCAARLAAIENEQKDSERRRERAQVLIAQQPALDAKVYKAACDAGYRDSELCLQQAVDRSPWINPSALRPVVCAAVERCKDKSLLSP